MTRRSKLEIWMDLLRACVEPTPPTRIMYASNLSWVPLRLYMRELVERDLIAPVKGFDKRSKAVFVATSRGKLLLRVWDDLFKATSREHRDRAKPVSELEDTVTQMLKAIGSEVNIPAA